ncbi:flagellar motor protein MotB [Savagea faecisuis]|uniref:Flagellar motor protein MotB n=1 Tax=Savagea faecisuis TaxID=1274803 RepID=A0ABW3H553_9BACL
MAKERRKKKQEECADESWLLPYADLLTLLLALFIVLFASSSIDQERMQRLSSVFNDIFDGNSGIMQNNSPTEVPRPSDSNQELENSSYLEDQRSLGEIQEKLDEYIALNELEGQFETHLTDEGLLITIRDSILFEMGKAEVSAEYLPLVEEVAELLIFDRPRQVIITGHTDNIPINTAEYASNWELSMMRALNFLRALVAHEDMDPSFFSAKGYGEYQPIASNDTAEGRSKNRRVEVLIQPLITKDGTTLPLP